ncbi:histidine phosphatase family protein [Candidimonas sp. SYP-B2681]|uniref:histidine phosphatase family protein n=1 Tax=Candidimonas sp. SYP-B2681 TaxID=2497686 RepID=UPI000F871F49|nr:histidine phosphatase family protein [Candidimonas sp. SYP-B2681]RTZ47672.1 histidine phosphatase family protein [Candidimonas sp. SYP-B2681]
MDNPSINEFRVPGSSWARLACWRRLVATVCIITGIGAVPDAVLAQSAWAHLQDNAVVLFRHANAPGVGDPANFRLGDCSTQRNLDDKGRTQARQIGEQFRKRQITVGKVLTSQWCRARETAQLAFPDLASDAAAFNSFFNDPAVRQTQTATARTIIEEWKGPGVLVVVTHQVNITALTGVFPASGEGVVVTTADGKIRVAGTVQP